MALSKKPKSSEHWSDPHCSLPTLPPASSPPTLSRVLPSPHGPSSAHKASPQIPQGAASSFPPLPTHRLSGITLRETTPQLNTSTPAFAECQMTCCKSHLPLDQGCLTPLLYPCTSHRPGIQDMHGILLAECSLLSLILLPLGKRTCLLVAAVGG